MPDYASAITGRLPLVLLLIGLSGCDWVDSTGVQGSTVAVSLRDGEAVAMTEGLALTAPLAGEDAGLTGWNWEAEQTDVRERCSSFSGFDPQLAVTSLDEACSADSACHFAIDETGSDTAATSFTLQMPALRAPLALSYRLRASREDGTAAERQQLICGLSVNEAPSALDDSYLATPGELLIVDAGNGLLANDSDDDDIRNVPLAVSAIVTQPIHATQFSVDPDGGFLYEPQADITLNDSGLAEDHFVYLLSDGVHEVRATAIIHIARHNDAPEQLQAIPDVLLTAHASIETTTPDTQLVDLSLYFSDPDGNVLTYSVAQDQLPASGNITVNSAGQLRAAPTLVDIGRYRPELLVSDGLESISTVFLLTVAEPDAIEDNRAPVARDISNRIVRDQFEYDTSGFFSDPDGDELTFSAEGLPDGVEIDTDGVIRGEASSSNEGRWLVRVHANDGKGGTTSDAFQLNIR